MDPAVPLPSKSAVRIPVELKLKSKWRFLPERRVFRSDSGEEFVPWNDLPRKSRIVYKVPSLAESNEAELSMEEKELRRYMQLILPQGHPPEDYLRTVRSWPSVAEAHRAPEVTLPTQK